MDRTNEELLDLFADLLEPVSAIVSDSDFVKLLQAGQMIPAVQVAIKGHKKEVIEMLALIDGKRPEDYKVNLVLLPFRLVRIFNDPEIINLFTSQEQENDAESSGSATESIRGGAN